MQVHVVSGSIVRWATQKRATTINQSRCYQAPVAAAVCGCVASNDAIKGKFVFRILVYSKCQSEQTQNQPERSVTRSASRQLWGAGALRQHAVCPRAKTLCASAFRTVSVSSIAWTCLIGSRRGHRPACRPQAYQQSPSDEASYQTSENREVASKYGTSDHFFVLTSLTQQ